MGYRVTYVKDLDKYRDILDDLDKETFPKGEPIYRKTGSEWWIVWWEGKPVGFAGIKFVEPGTAFLCRCGILRKHQGKGLQRKLIKIRENFARKNKIKDIITYTHSNTTKSANNLIAAGYRLYMPEKNWGWLPLKESLFWIKRLTA